MFFLHKNGILFSVLYCPHKVQLGDTIINFKFTCVYMLQVEKSSQKGATSVLQHAVHFYIKGGGLKSALVIINKEWRR